MSKATARRGRLRDRHTPASLVLDDEEDATLLDVLDNLLNKGVVANGDLVLGVAGVDLIYLRLSTLLCAIDRVMSPAVSPRKRRSRGPRPLKRPRRPGRPGGPGGQ